MGKARAFWIIVILLLAGTVILGGTYEIALCFPVLFLLLATDIVLYIGSGRKLSLELTFPTRMEKNIPAEGRIQIKNHSWLPVWRGTIYLEWKNILTGETGTEEYVFGVLSKARTEVELTFSSVHCGACRFQIKRLRVFDILQLFSAKRRADETGTLLVYPKAEEVSVDVLDNEAYDMESFRYSEYRKGDDSSETFDIREYVQGDSIRKIHWKLTGKMDAIMIRESSYPIFNSLMLIWETGKTDKSSPEKTDAAMCVCVSVAQMLIRQKVAFELGYYDHKKEFFFTERIETEEQLWSVVPGMLQAKRKVTEYSSCYQYQCCCGDRAFAHYVYVTGEEAFEDLKIIGAEENITILRCGTRSGVIGNLHIFTAEKWKEELA